MREAPRRATRARPRAADYLDGIRDAVRALGPMERELRAYEYARDSGLPWQSHEAYGHVGPSFSNPTATMAERRTGELAAIIERKRAALAHARDRVDDCRHALRWMARDLGNTHAKVLELYYLDLAQTWSEVACEVGVSYRTVLRKRTEAYEWMDERCGSLVWP